MIGTARHRGLAARTTTQLLDLFDFHINAFANNQREFRMGRPKRNAAEAGIVGRAIAASDAKKARKEVAATAAGLRSRRATGDETVKLGPKRTSELETTTNGKSKKPSRGSIKESAAPKKAPVPKKAKASKTSKLGTEAPAKKSVGRPRKDSSVSVSIPKKNKSARSEEQAEQNGEAGGSEEDDEDDEISYWLMKAEPESRIEKGVDVKFSIDDLKNKEAPEAWDGEIYSASLPLELG